MIKLQYMQSLVYFYTSVNNHGTYVIFPSTVKKKLLTACPNKLHTVVLWAVLKKRMLAKSALFCSGMQALILKKHLHNFKFTISFLQSLIVLVEVLVSEWALFTAAGFMMCKR